jgi:hypothetical protein
MSKLQFDTEADLDKWLKKATKASRIAQVKPKAPDATNDVVKRLQAKIKRLEKANEGLMLRIMELERK